jgi:predicted nucleotidyltransferase
MDSSLEDYQAVLREHLTELKEQWHVQTLELFGSRVRNEARPDSDLDVMVTFGQTPGLFRFVELEFFLSELLGVKVDLVTRDSLKPHVRDRVLSEAIAIGEQQIQSGNTVSHEDAKKRLSKWLD